MLATSALNGMWLQRHRKGLKRQHTWLCQVTYWSSLRFTCLLLFRPPSHVTPTTWPCRIPSLGFHLNVESPNLLHSCHGLFSTPSPLAVAWAGTRSRAVIFNVRTLRFTISENAQETRQGLYSSQENVLVGPDGRRRRKKKEWRVKLI